MPSAVMEPPMTPGMQQQQQQQQSQTQPLAPMMGNRGFNIAHQKVGLEVDLAGKCLRGWTEITINPTDPSLKTIRLNSRQCDVVKCSINGRSASQVKYNEPYANFKIHDTATVHQHQMLRKKLEGVLHDPLEHELVITIPSKVRIEPADPLNGGTQQAPPVRNGLSSRQTPDLAASAGPPTPGAPLAPRPDSMYTPYVPLNLRIEFKIDKIRDGFTFVGCDSGDLRYPHAYTTNTPLPGASCCLFPTLDGIHERWTWEFEITVPRTLADIHKNETTEAAAAVETTEGLTNGINGTVMDETEDTPMEEEDADGDLELLVVCSGDLTDEDIHPTQPWKKVVKFQQGQAVAPQHVSIAVGPFEKVNLSEYRDVENEEAMGTMSVDVMGYCLPGRESDLKNTCMFLPKAIDFIVKEFGQYVFSAFQLCFVDDLATDTVESASLALCSNQLLFPETVIDAIWPVTRTLTYALTAQWAGVQVVPKDWADIWVIVGIAYWMTGCFLKNLMGNNEYRFRLKKDSEKICELDIGRASLYAQGFQVPIEPSQLDFIKLKAPVVLTILEKRLWKLSSSMVLHRVVRKTFLSAVAGELKNGLMSTAHFIRLCEKNSHNKLDAFFQQWVYGAGYPIFEVSQRFNKKRMIVEMGIRQAQNPSHPQTRRVCPDDFMKDANDHQRNVVFAPTQPVFTGPMTIRIHEADGTPYEHVVDLKEGYTKLDIPYNTKYKRLKRSRRQKERAAAGAGVDVSIDAQQNDDVLLYCLGDVLQSEEEVDYWRLVDWTKEDEEKMSQESFEWIRMDADFEWICQLHINQPDYMFLSQLQQDRDVIAQYDSIRHFATVRESGLVSSILVRALMDRRYYYGIRVEAALALARCATADLEWVGQFHLMKAFQEFFCFPDSPIPKGNDFSDFTAYYVQNAIPQAMSCIRNLSGVCPSNVQKWLLDLLRYNDNSNNTFDDCYYIANLMKSLANTLTPKQPTPAEFDYGFEFEDTEGQQAQENAIKEIGRYQRMDQWQPSYRNIISETALDIRRLLTRRGVQDLDYRMFMSYCREGTLDTLRAKALGCLVDLGALRNPALLKYICTVMAYDPSPYVRRRVQKAFGRGLGMLATGENEPSEQRGPDPNSLMIEDEAAVDTVQAERKDELAKETIEGAIKALKASLADNQVMKDALWHAVRSPELGLIELRYFLDICNLLYDSKNSWIIVLKQPKHLSVKHLGKGRLHFKWTYRKPIPSEPTPKPQPSSSAPQPSAFSTPKPNRPPSIKLITNPRGRINPSPNSVNGSSRKSREPKASPGRRTPSFSHTPTPSMPPPSSATPNSQGPPRAKIILKIGNKNHLQQNNLHQNGT